MEESEKGKVRLVRCPKCQNLLPEQPHFSVYQCGGCGAILRAKNKNASAENLSEKSNDQKIGRIPQKPDSYEEKGSLNMQDNSDANMMTKSDSLRPDSECWNDDEARHGEKYTNLTKDAVNKGVVEGDAHISRTKTDSRDTVTRMEYREGKLLDENSNTSHKSRLVSDWQNREGDELRGSPRNSTKGASGVARNHNEGPSSYHSSSFRRSQKLTKEDEDSNVLKKLNHLEQERAGLLRMLDELKDQLSRTCDVSNKPKGTVPLDSNQDNWCRVGSLVPNRASMLNPIPEKHITHPPYFNHGPEPYPYPQRLDVDAHSFLPSVLASDHLHAYGNPLESQLHGRALPPGNINYQQPSCSYIPGQYFHSEPEPIEPYPYDLAHHQPACSCIQCYSRYPHFLQHGPPVSLQNRQFQEVPHNLLVNRYKNSASYNSRARDPHILHPTRSSSCESRPYSRKPSSLNSEFGGLRNHPQSIAVGGSKHRFRPIAGGAPFLTCCSCSELLILPQKSLNSQKDRRIVVKCGACSAVVKYAVHNKRLVFSLLEKKRRNSGKANDGSRKVEEDKSSHIHSHVNHTSVNNSFDDYDGSGYVFQALDQEPNLAFQGQGSNLSQPQEMQRLHSSSPTTSEDENSPNIQVPEIEQNNHAHWPIKETSPPPPGSFLQEHLDDSNYKNVKRFAHGNLSSRSDHEKVVKLTMRQNSLKETSLATEMDTSFNGFSNPGEDSRDSTREDDQRRPNRENESFLANIIKKSLPKSNQGVVYGKLNVSINGNSVPDHLVKKAEKFAGPIRPGQYWYDYRAGFWGVMGGPCLGIIPPSIEEFNYPISEGCSGGNTGIFVNGRELHQNDLELLSSRGLPTDRDKSYIVEISGRVWDAHTGVELDCLGKLAPTVQKMKRGFGMKVPRTSTK